jgi:hypothetical protein
VPWSLINTRDRKADVSRSTYHNYENGHSTILNSAKYMILSLASLKSVLRYCCATVTRI